MAKKIALVLAGGKGSRLWPLSREDYPKQFVEFIEGKSLFQLTLERVRKFLSPVDIFVVTSWDYKFNVVNQIEAMKSLSNLEKRNLKRNVILEPTSKNTAPAVLLAIKLLEKRLDDDDILFVFSSDHIIEPQEKFIQSLLKAEKIASLGYLVIFGVKPTEENPGYGYIISGDRIKYGFRVKRFVEKPSSRMLKKLLRKGALWNSGMFAFRKNLFLEELKKSSPKMFEYYLLPKEVFLSKFFEIPEGSLDYLILERTKRAALVRLNAKWSDLGSWDSFFKYFSKRKGNFNIGEAKFFEAQNCFSFSYEKLISFLGTEDIVVVEDSDTILVMRKGFSQKVKDLIKLLKKEGLPQVKYGRVVYRPWGYYIVLKEQANYKVKEIGIYPKKYISLQKHKYRSEHWNVVEGEIEVILQDKTIRVKKNQSFFVPKGVKHKIYNPKNKIAKAVEVQIGSYVGEDDIVRFDHY